MKQIQKGDTIPITETSMAIVQDYPGSLRKYYIFVPLDDYTYLSMTREQFKAHLAKHIKQAADQAIDIIMKDYDESKSS